MSAESRLPSGLRPAFFGVLRESPALHVRLLQVVAFAYLLYRFASRDYSVFGRLPADAFDYPRTIFVEFLPVPLLHVTTFQFIYAFLPRPSPETISALQGVIVAACALGLGGVAPRAAAWITLALAGHLTGMVQSSNAETDGGDLALCAMLILAIAPGACFYRLGRRSGPPDRSASYHWPIFLLWLVTGAFYTFSGLNKLLDVGPHWPFALHLERQARLSLEDALFVSSRYAHPPTAAAHLSYPLSVALGTITFLGELFFISILWLPRLRPLLVATMSGFHVAVYLTCGINFLGSAAILMLCLDWNRLARKATAFYDADCGFCGRVATRLQAWDVFKLTSWVPIGTDGPGSDKLDTARLKDELGLVDENGEVHYGSDAFRELACRIPFLYPLALIYLIPGIPWVGRKVYRRIATRRHGACVLGSSSRPK